MKVENLLKSALNGQGIDKSIDKICFNVVLKNELIYTVCFLVEEDDKWLTFVETSEDGLEKVRMVNKDYICSIEVIYNEELLLFFGDEEEENYANHVYC